MVLRPLRPIARMAPEWVLVFFLLLRLGTCSLYYFRPIYHGLLGITSIMSVLPLGQKNHKKIFCPGGKTDTHIKYIIFPSSPYHIFLLIAECIFYIQKTPHLPLLLLASHLLTWAYLLQKKYPYSQSYPESYLWSYRYLCRPRYSSQLFYSILAPVTWFIIVS